MENVFLSFCRYVMHTDAALVTYCLFCWLKQHSRRTVKPFSSKFVAFGLVVWTRFVWLSVLGFAVVLDLVVALCSW